MVAGLPVVSSLAYSLVVYKSNQNGSSHHSPRPPAYPWRCRLVGSADAGESGVGTYPSSAIRRSSGDGHAFLS